MKHIKKCLCLFILHLSFISIQFVKAQNYEWLKSFGVKAYSETTWLSVPEPDGGLTTIIQWAPPKLGLPQDTLFIDTFKFVHEFKSGYGTPSCLVRLDSNGNVLSAKYLGTATFATFCKDDRGNYYIGGEIRRVSNIIGNDTLDWLKGSLVCSKFDKNFNHLWSSQTGGDSLGRSYTKFKFSNGKLLFIAGLWKNSIIGKDTYDVIYQWAHIFGELDTSSGEVLWSQLYFQRKIGTGGFYLADILRMPSGCLYLVGSTHEEDYVKDGDSFNRFSGFVIKTDSFGNYQKRFLLKGGYNYRTYDPRWPNSIYAIGNYDSVLIISGSMGNDINWGGKKITKSLDSGLFGYEGFIAGISEDLQEGFFYKPDFVSGGKWYGSNNYNNFSSFKFAIKHGSIYALGGTSYSLKADSLQVLVDTSQPYSYGSFLLKMDLKGEIIWGSNFALDSQGWGGWGYWGGWGGWGGWGSWGGWDQNFISATTSAVFMTGPYKSKINFPPHSAKSKGDYDVFVLKITDNIIYRGNVSPGPYCAGDTLYIPYTTKGIFDSLNYFIAELSNEKGEFDSNTRRLGVLRGNKDSSIRAVLPLNNVVSSYNYKIRISATRPYCNNDFVSDTLRLTIYSKDKADAGLDIGICPGDTTILQAKGGTNYQWTPAINMEDSAGVKTKIWPNISTQYRLIVSDSSGCSMTDTAYKTVEIRAAKIALSSGDTIVCIDDYLHLKATFTGVDSKKFKWKWWLIEFGYVNEIEIDSGKASDILKFSFDLGYSVKLRVTLDNGCPNSKDTATIEVLIPKPLKVVPDEFNKSVCYGESAKLYATGNGGTKPNYKFEWRDINTNQLLGTKDTLYLQSYSNRKLMLRLSDGCMEVDDTQYINVFVRAPLVVNSNLRDTTLCFGNHVNYTALGSGGSSSKHQYQWMLDGTTIGTNQNLDFASEKHFNSVGGKKQLKLILSDGCTEKSDTATSEMVVSRKLEVKVGQLATDSTVCWEDKVTLHASGVGGNGNYVYQWFDPNNMQIGTADSVAITNNKTNQTGIQNYRVILSDGCSKPADTQSIKLNLLSKLKTSIAAHDSCLTSASTLTCTTTGGDGNYQNQWYENQIEKGQNNTLNIPLPQNETQYTFKAMDGCGDSALAITQVSTFPKISFTNNQDSGCELLPINFSIKKQNNTTNLYRYNHAGSVSNWRNDSNFIFNFKQGNYTPFVEVMTVLGCADTFYSKPITVYPKPLALYSYSPSKPTPQLPEIQFKNLSNGAEQYSWDFGKFGNSSAVHPKISITESGLHTITLVAISDRGCRDSSTGLLKVYDNYQIFMPTAFSPNGDGLNDVLAPQILGAETYTLQIYNRWGLLIYEGENKGWDGNYKGKLQIEDMYVFYLKITTDNFETMVEKGTVMLLNK